MLFIIYSNFMKHIFETFKELVQADKYTEIDTLLEKVHTSWEYTEDQINKHEEILKEITLFSEFKEEQYKIEALYMIEKVI